MGIAVQEVADQHRAAAPRPWHWPLYPFAVTVAIGTFAAALVANYPAVVVPRVNADLDDFGYLSPIRSYEHGWPARYVHRDATGEVTIDSGSVPNMKSIEASSPWKPWQHVRTFSAGALVWDAIAWLGIILGAAVLAQRWRSKRRALWQPQLIDLLALTTAIALMVGWVAKERLAARQERALISAVSLRVGDARYEEIFDVEVPLLLPNAWQDDYRALFGRVRYSSGESSIACQFSRLTVYTVQGPPHLWRQHFERMGQVEGLDFLLASPLYLDATRQATTLRDLPAMPNLRAVNLNGTNATDADMAWLAKCRRLEAINAPETGVGDEGIRLLSMLPRLSKLSLAGRRVTDEGCRRLVAFPALVELRLASSSIGDEGVRALGACKQLRILNVSASASEEAFADLKMALPGCTVSTARYRGTN